MGRPDLNISSSTRLPELDQASRNQEGMNIDTSESINPNRKISIHKYRKKQAANDAQLLMNRIALLQKEEERARKKVDQTKERALDILAMREENDRRNREILKVAEEERKMREDIHRKNFETEEQSRILKKVHVDAVMKKKRQEVEQIRDQKHVLRDEMLKMKEADVKKKQKMRLEIRRKEEEARIKREEEKRLHDQKIKEYYEQKAKAEEAEARRAEKLVKKLERKEREWVEKLRNAQQVQENAFMELESALVHQSPDGTQSANYFPLGDVDEPETGSPDGDGTSSATGLSSSRSGLEGSREGEQKPKRKQGSKKKISKPSTS